MKLHQSRATLTSRDSLDYSMAIYGIFLGRDGRPLYNTDSTEPQEEQNIHLCVFGGHLVEDIASNAMETLNGYIR